LEELFFARFKKKIKKAEIILRYVNHKSNVVDQAQAIGAEVLNLHDCKMLERRMFTPNPFWFQTDVLSKPLGVFDKYRGVKFYGYSEFLDQDFEKSWSCNYFRCKIRV